jgi:hypothetical protein
MNATAFLRTRPRPVLSKKLKLFLAATIAAVAMVVFAPHAIAAPVIYVVTSNQQFGMVDLATGEFHQIGAGTPEPLANLVWAPHGFLLSLSVSGNLDRIDPATGEVSVIGQTGLGGNAFDLAEARGRLYATDLSNNIYSVDPESGAATFLRITGIPADPAHPFSSNSDGTINLCDEGLYAVNGNLYATFDAFTLNPSNLVLTPTVSPALYRIDPSTGAASFVANTILNLGSTVEVRGRFYGFKWVTLSFTDLGPQLQSQLFTLDLATGQTKFIRNIDGAAAGIMGAVPLRRPW